MDENAVPSDGEEYFVEEQQQEEEQESPPPGIEESPTDDTALQMEPPPEESEQSSQQPGSNKGETSKGKTTTKPKPAPKKKQKQKKKTGRRPKKRNAKNMQILPFYTPMPGFCMDPLRPPWCYYAPPPLPPPFSCPVNETSMLPFAPGHVRPQRHPQQDPPAPFAGHPGTPFAVQPGQVAGVPPSLNPALPTAPGPSVRTETSRASASVSGVPVSETKCPLQFTPTDLQCRDADTLLDEILDAERPSPPWEGCQGGVPTLPDSASQLLVDDFLNLGFPQPHASPNLQPCQSPNLQPCPSPNLWPQPSDSTPLLPLQDMSHYLGEDVRSFIDRVAKPDDLSMDDSKSPEGCQQESGATSRSNSPEKTTSSDKQGAFPIKSFIKELFKDSPMFSLNMKSIAILQQNIDDLDDPYLREINVYSGPQVKQQCQSSPQQPMDDDEVMQQQLQHYDGMLPASGSAQYVSPGSQRPSCMHALANLQPAQFGPGALSQPPHSPSTAMVKPEVYNPSCLAQADSGGGIAYQTSQSLLQDPSTAHDQVHDHTGQSQSQPGMSQCAISHPTTLIHLEQPRQSESQHTTGPPM